MTEPFDPADLWESYCAEVPDPADQSPQGAMAFACEHLLARHAQSPSLDPLPLAVRLRDEGGPLPQMIAQRRAALADAQSPIPRDMAAQTRAEIIEECAKIADSQTVNLDAGFGWGAWLETEHQLMRGVSVKIAADIRALGTVSSTEAPAAQTRANIIEECAKVIELSDLWDNNGEIAKAVRALVPLSSTEAPSGAVVECAARSGARRSKPA